MIKVQLSSIFIAFCTLVCFLTAVHIVDIYSLIDPLYYLEAINGINNIYDHNSQNTIWLRDVIFSGLMTGLGILNLDSYWSFYVIVLLQFSILALILKTIRKKKGFLLVSLALIFNVTVFTGILNVWRQSFAELIFILSFLFIQSRLLRIIPIGFHIYSGIVYIAFRWVTERSFIFILASSVALFFLVGILFSFLPEIMINAYGYENIKVDMVKLYAAFIFMVIIALNIKGSELRIDVFYFLCLIIFFCFSIFEILPNATDRFIRIFFLAFPLLFVDLNFKLRKNLVFLFVLCAFILINLYAIFSSNTFMISFLG